MSPPRKSAGNLLAYAAIVPLILTAVIGIRFRSGLGAWWGYAALAAAGVIVVIVVAVHDREHRSRGEPPHLAFRRPKPPPGTAGSGGGTVAQVVVASENEPRLVGEQVGHLPPSDPVDIAVICATALAVPPLGLWLSMRRLRGEMRYSAQRGVAVIGMALSAATLCFIIVTAVAQV